MRGRRAIGLPLDAAEADLQRRISRARRAVDGLIARVEREPRAKVPPELRNEIEKFKRGPQGHRCPLDHRYVYVALADVRQDVRDAVADGVRRAVNRLNGFPANSNVTPPLPEPWVRYFRGAKDNERADFTDHRILYGRHQLETSFIDLRLDNRTPAQCRSVACHEVFHWGGDDRFRLDNDAADRFSSELVLSA